MKKLTTIVLAMLVLTLSAFAYEGQIDGEYNGWDGDTIYRLMDGHIIQQTTYHYHYHYAYSPHVVIYRSNGGLKCIVEGDDDEPIGISVIR